MAILSENQLKELKELGINSMGVVQRDAAFAETYTSRILVIGLGGMGLKTLRRLKKELNDRVGKVDGSYLRLLSIDTDKLDREDAINEGILTADEIPLLVNTSLSSILSARPEERPRSVNEIIPNGFAQVLTGDGANQVRLAGRLTLMESGLFTKICESISTAIKGLANFENETLDVHVVAGIGGGSGSGMIVDMPYIVRAVVQKLGISSSKLRLFGHVYLPNSYEGISNYESAKRNGYAALKEIDYYMTLESIGETYDVLYPNPEYGRNGRFSSESNIFNQCTLIGGRLATAILPAHPQEKAISVCVEDLVNQCTSVKGNIDDKTGSITDFFTSGSFQTNADNALNTVLANADAKFPLHGNYSYNIIGATSIKFPTATISEQLVGEMSQKAEDIFTANIANLGQEDVDAFESGLLKPSEIIEQQVAKLEEKIDAFFDDREVVWNRSNFRDQTHKDPLENAVQDVISEFDKDNSLMEKVQGAANSKAAEIFKDDRKGPYYLEKLLTTNSNSGGIQGFYQKLGGYYDAVLGMKNRAEEDVKSYTETANERSEKMEKFGHFNSNLSAYQEDLKAIYVAKFKIRLCDILMASYYVDMNERRGNSYNLKSRLDNVYLSMVDVVREINRIAIANLKIANAKLSESSEDDPTSIFSLQEPVFDALKSTVRNTVVNKLNVLGDTAGSKYAAALASEIISNREQWTVSDTTVFGNSKCADAFRRFVYGYEPFADVLKCKMVDYFEKAYVGVGEGEKTKVVEKLLGVVKNYSAPMFNVWDKPHFDFAHINPLCFSYLVLPDGLSNGSEWGTRFGSQFGTNGMTKNIYWSPDQDAIYCYTLYAKIPIWLHKDLIEYEEQYNKLTMQGVHINEGSDTKPLMKEYPALMTYSQWWRARNGGNEYSFAPELDMMEKVKAKFYDAYENHIIEKNDVGCFVVHTIKDKPNPETMEKSIEKFVKKYCDDKSNYTDKGKIIIGAKLFLALCNEYGCEDKIIYGARGGFNADTEESAIMLLRKQMKLLQVLIDEIDYYRNEFVTRVKKITNVGEYDEQIRKFTKYFLYGFIYEENRNWNYKVGDSSYNIVLRAKVDAKLRDYMEMASVDALWKLEDFPAHEERILRVIDNRIDKMAMHDADGEVLLAEMREKAGVLKTRCNEIIQKFVDKFNNGNDLTEEEEKCKKFYETVVDQIDIELDAF